MKFIKKKLKLNTKIIAQIQVKLIRIKELPTTNYFLRIMALDINVIALRQDVINFIVNVLIKADIVMDAIVLIVIIKSQIIYQVINVQKKAKKKIKQY